MLMLVLLAGCPDGGPSDVCGIASTGPGGSVEVGLGDPFIPVVEGMDVSAEFGLQGFYMFVVNARVRDLGVIDGEAAVDFELTGAGGEALSRDNGCRVRMFTDIGGGTWQLDSASFLAIAPAFTATLDGTQVTLRVTVTDAAGLRAVDERAFTARLPLTPGAR